MDQQQQQTTYDQTYQSRYEFWFKYFEDTFMAETNARIDAAEQAGN